MDENIKPLSDIPAINRFLSYCRIRTVPSKTVVIHAGDLPDVLYYIISGSVEVMIEDEEGNEMVLAYLNRGQFFGEMGLFYEQPTRSAWVRTRNQCELAEMTYPRFRQIAAESPGLIFELATQLAARLDRTNRKLGDLAVVDVTGRVAHAIMDLCGEPDAMTHPEGMQIKVSRKELSRLVGCSREMAGRVLKVLEEQGLLRATGKTIVVFNARPKMKTRPVIVPAKPGTTAGKAAPVSRDDDDEDADGHTPGEVERRPVAGDRHRVARPEAPLVEVVDPLEHEPDRDDDGDADDGGHDRLGVRAREVHRSRDSTASEKSLPRESTRRPARSRARSQPHPDAAHPGRPLREAGGGRTGAEDTARQA